MKNNGRSLEEQQNYICDKVGTNRADGISTECKYNYKGEKLSHGWLRRVMHFRRKAVYVCISVQNVYQCHGGIRSPGCSVQDVRLV